MSSRVLACVILLGIICPFTMAEGDRQQKTRILHSDLPQSTEIIGRLGEPLGRVFEVTAKWITVEGRNGYELELHVITVNKRPLEKPVIFSSDQSKQWMFTEKVRLNLNFGQQRRLRVFESGGFSGAPAEQFDYYQKKTGQEIPYQAGRSLGDDYPPFRFVTRIVVLEELK